MMACVGWQRATLPDARVERIDCWGSALSCKRLEYREQRGLVLWDRCGSWCRSRSSGWMRSPASAARGDTLAAAWHAGDGETK